ncbi:MAG: pyrimidine/purine nucleoside phosphorylase [Gammaproteobacteria bacterium]|nr:pyrimidine/purine nucleoside phosphorylase [Gammaproteobacteria bacterium]
MIKHNSYFDNNVQSLGFATDTKPASVGVMAAGEYRFGTGAAERMEVISGALTVLLPGQTEWETFAAGQGFDVPGNSHFDLQVAVSTAYLCIYG